MAFKKGISGNPDGRPIGSANKTSLQLREAITDFLETNFEKIRTDFEDLKPKDRAKLYCDLLQYGLPKLQAIHGENSDINKIVVVVRRTNEGVNNPLKEQE